MRTCAHARLSLGAWTAPTHGPAPIAMDAAHHPRRSAPLPLPRVRSKLPATFDHDSGRLCSDIYTRTQTPSTPLPAHPCTLDALAGFVFVLPMLSPTPPPATKLQQKLSHIGHLKAHVKRKLPCHRRTLPLLQHTHPCNQGGSASNSAHPAPSPLPGISGLTTTPLSCHRQLCESGAPASTNRASPLQPEVEVREGASVVPCIAPPDTRRHHAT